MATQSLITDWPHKNPGVVGSAYEKLCRRLPSSVLVAFWVLENLRMFDGSDCITLVVSSKNIVDYQFLTTCDGLQDGTYQNQGICDKSTRRFVPESRPQKTINSSDCIHFPDFHRSHRVLRACEI